MTEHVEVNRHRLSTVPNTGLREALENLERQTVELYRSIAPAGNYGANKVGSPRNENTFADRDEFILAARTALSTHQDVSAVRTDSGQASVPQGDGLRDSVVEQLVINGRAKKDSLNAEQRAAADAEARAFYRNVIDTYLAALNANPTPDSGQAAVDGEVAVAGFACPICGQETPHHHTAPVVDAYQNKGSRK